MEIDFALLCLGVHEGLPGLLNLEGVGIAILEASVFPIRSAPLHLVVSVRARPEECGRPHTLTTQGWDEQTGAIGSPFNLPIRLDVNPVDRSRDSSHVYVQSFPNVTFPHRGEYEFRIQIDGELKAVVVLFVAERPPA